MLTRKYLIGLLIVLGSVSVFSQITGNISVVDRKAVELDTTKIKLLIGKWRCTTFEHKFQGETTVTSIKEIYLTLFDDGRYIQRRCSDCDYGSEGRWRIVPNNTIEFEHGPRSYKQEFEGKWVAYVLSEERLTLVRILTSNSDWTKTFEFEKIK